MVIGKKNKMVGNNISLFFDICIGVIIVLGSIREMVSSLIKSEPILWGPVIFEIAIGCACFAFGIWLTKQRKRIPENLVMLEGQYLILARQGEFTELVKKPVKILLSDIDQVTPIASLYRKSGELVIKMRGSGRLYTQSYIANVEKVAETINEVIAKHSASK